MTNSISSLDDDEIFYRIHQEHKTERNTLPFQEAFLRRLLAGDKTTEEELIQSRFLLPGGAIPNVVCFIQGFVRAPGSKEQEGLAPSRIQEFFRERFQGYQLTFLSYRKHLLMLIQVPSEYISLMHWREGENRILDTIQALEKEFGIYLYIGVGSIYREPLLLHSSYREACKARRTTPYNRPSLRYFEEITKDVQIQKCTDYIAQPIKLILVYRTSVGFLNKKQDAILLNMSPLSVCSVQCGFCVIRIIQLSGSLKNLVSIHQIISVVPLKSMSAFLQGSTEQQQKLSSYNKGNSGNSICTKCVDAFLKSMATIHLAYLQIKIERKTELKNVSKLDDTSTSVATNHMKKDSTHVLSFFIFKT
jgi:hypothetical protein